MQLFYAQPELFSFPDSEFSYFMVELCAFLEQNPHLIALAERDLESHAFRDRQARLQHRWACAQTDELFKVEKAEEAPPASRRLGVGRPRMSAHEVLVWFVIRYFLNGVMSKIAASFAQESKTLDRYYLSGAIRR